MDGLWNVNIHYDARLAACVPAAAAAVLDVGCGDGFLAARLARRVPLVVGIDIDAPVLSRARARFPDAPVTWCHGDVLTHPLGQGRSTPCCPTPRCITCPMSGPRCAA